MFEKILGKLDKEISGKRDYNNERSERLVEEIKKNLFEKWAKELGIRMSHEIEADWCLLLRKLYHCKALNKSELYNQINYVRGFDIDRAFAYDREKNKKVGNY